MSNVLVVDDEGDSREFVARFLDRSGHQVTSAQDGRDALARLLEGTPDAVVLDVRMPHMDGIALLAVMRSYLRLQKIPVIILSANATPDQLRQVQDLGVSHVFHKAHFTLPDLGRAIAEVTDAN
jgi:chemosensory pili system protein ChpA (sensor histidine kinase/response regulator)